MRRVEGKQVQHKNIENNYCKGLKNFVHALYSLTGFKPMNYDTHRIMIK
jgi:hypothetical protein